MIGGEHIAAFGIDDHARAGCLHLFFELLGKIKKLPKDGIAVERIVLLYARVHRNVDDRRRRFSYHRSQGRNLVAARIRQLRDGWRPHDERAKKQKTSA